MLLLPVPVFAVDLYVNHVTGTDTPSCGQLAAQPCQTVQHTVSNIQDGQVTVKISKGSYTEGFIHFPTLSNLSSTEIILEGGWDSDFSSQTCDASRTVILTGLNTSSYDALFVLTVSGEDRVEAVSIRCLTIKKSETGTSEGGILGSAHSQGEADFTLADVEIRNFTGSAVEIQSYDNSSLSVITLEQVLFKANVGNSVFDVSAADYAQTNIVIRKCRFVNNGTENSSTHAISLGTYRQGKLDALLENSIVAANQSDMTTAGIYVDSRDYLSKTKFVLLNSTITGNVTQSYTAGMFLDSYDSGEIEVSLKNTILQGNQNILGNDPHHSDLLLNTVAPSILNFSADYNVLGGHSLNGSPTSYESTNEINSSPYLDNSCHLKVFSPAINSGQCGYRLVPPFNTYIRVAPYDDIDQNVRPGDGELFGCDIGADEYKPFPWPLFLPAFTISGL